MTGAWTLAELAERVADALRQSAPGAGAGNGRVREVPGERVIRWYTTIGLVDPPAARRGRVALYGERHLRQLVAIKRLQAQGRSIAEIQTLLAGATDDRLAAVADGEGRERFWASAPAADAPAVAGRADPPPAELPTVTPAVRLAPGVTLVLDGAGRTPAPDDLVALADAAAPLLAALRARGLTTAPADRAADTQGGAP